MEMSEDNRFYVDFDAEMGLFVGNCPKHGGFTSNVDECPKCMEGSYWRDLSKMEENFRCDKCHKRFFDHEHWYEFHGVFGAVEDYPDNLESADEYNSDMRICDECLNKLKIDRNGFKCGKCNSEYNEFYDEEEKLLLFFEVVKVYGGCEDVVDFESTRQFLCWNCLDKIKKNKISKL